VETPYFYWQMGESKEQTYMLKYRENGKMGVIDCGSQAGYARESGV